MKRYKTLIILFILIALGVLYYISLSADGRNEKKKEKNSYKEEISELINMDLDKNYPSDPRDVVEFYSRILTCFYSGNCTAGDIADLAMQTREIFDDELIEMNPENEYIKNLKADIRQYKEEKRTISTYIIEKSGEIKYKTFQSHYYAIVGCDYYIKGEKSTFRTSETYTLRKDSEGKWKILYWSLTPKQKDDSQNGK